MEELKKKYELVKNHIWRSDNVNMSEYFKLYKEMFEEYIKEISEVAYGSKEFRNNYGISDLIHESSAMLFHLSYYHLKKTDIDVETRIITERYLAMIHKTIERGDFNRFSVYIYNKQGNQWRHYEYSNEEKRYIPTDSTVLEFGEKDIQYLVKELDRQGLEENEYTNSLRESIGYLEKRLKKCKGDV